MAAAEGGAAAAAPLARDRVVVVFYDPAGCYEHLASGGIDAVYGPYTEAEVDAARERVERAIADEGDKNATVQARRIKRWAL